MATTGKHQPGSNEYIQVVSGTTNAFLLQNASKDKTVVSVIWGTSVPAPDDPGHPLQPGDALTRASLNGNVYARGLTGDATVVVTEE